MVEVFPEMNSVVSSAPCTHTDGVPLEDLRLEPGQVVHADLVLLAGDGDQYVLPFQYLHLLEPSARYQLVNCNAKLKPTHDVNNFKGKTLSGRSATLHVKSAKNVSEQRASIVFWPCTAWKSGLTVVQRSTKIKSGLQTTAGGQECACVWLDMLLI